MKVLIVDDNPPARRMLKQYLRDFADETRECADGAEALPVYREFLPDWVLMDCEMKRVSGIEATGQLIGEFPGARIIIVTNYDEDHLRQAAEAAGAVGFVLKDDLSALDAFWENS